MWQEKAASVKSSMLSSLLPVGGAYCTELTQPAGLEVDRALWPAQQPAFLPLCHSWHRIRSIRPGTPMLALEMALCCGPAQPGPNKPA